jgi:membrane protease subunit (stomatin/prohibitin family)
MDLEVRSMAGAVRSELQGRVRGYKAALAEMKKRTRAARCARKGVCFFHARMTS